VTGTTKMRTHRRSHSQQPQKAEKREADVGVGRVDSRADTFLGIVEASAHGLDGFNSTAQSITNKLEVVVKNGEGSWPSTDIDYE